MKQRFGGLWQQPNFLKLWTAQTISVFGSQVTNLALPLTAVLVLNATPSEMGILGVAGFAPFLLISLFAGVWVDQLRRRPILITADIGRAVLLGSLPVAAILGMLNMGYLYVIQFLVGILTVFFDISYQAFLPSLVKREELVEGNSKLEVTNSLARIAGPGMAGVLVQVLTAPFAIIVDAVSFLFSGFFLWLIKIKEAKEPQPEQKRSMWSQIGEGWSVVFGNPLLRSIAGCTSTGNFFSQFIGTVFAIYAVRELKLEPFMLGVIFGVASIGGLAGALFANKIAKWFGLGHTIIIMALAMGIGQLLIPLAGIVSGFVTIAFLLVSEIIVGIAAITYNINQVSLRQAITPQRLQGRMNATMRFIVWGTIPVGALIGGFLAEAIGIVPCMWLGAIGSTLATGWVLFSPVRKLREQPQPTEEAVAVS